jgi:hypothetical protein
MGTQSPPCHSEYSTNKVFARKVQCPKGHFVEVARGFNRQGI